MAKRISVNLMQDAEKSLSALVEKHECWLYRNNTIVQAAIVAFSEMSHERQIDYLRRIRKKDRRFR